VRPCRRVPVDTRPPLPDLDRLTGNGDRPLDKVAAGIARIAKDDDIAALRRLKEIDGPAVRILRPANKGEEPLEEVHIDVPVDGLVHQQVLAAVERRLHAPPFHSEVLDDRADEQEDDQRENERLQNVPHCALHGTGAPAGWTAPAIIV